MLEQQPAEPDRHERFLAVFLPCQGDLRAFMRSILWDRAKFDDLFQEVALILWRQFDTYDVARSFGAWARGVATKVVLKHLERDRRFPVLLSPEALEALQRAFSDLEGGPDGDAEAALRMCVQRLPERSQILLRLRYQQDLQLADIATRVKSTPDAIHKALSRLRSGLQLCVERQLRVLR